MVSRAYTIPGVILLLAATGLLIVASVSLPALPALDIVRVQVKNGTVFVGNVLNSPSISQLRFGIWSYCANEIQTGNRDCSSSGYGYSVAIHSTNTVVTIQPSWTKGLAIVPVAAVVSFIALLFSFSTHVQVALLSSLASFLAAALTLIAFLVEIALYAWVHHEVSKLKGVSQKTNTAPGFWLTFVSLFLLLFAGCTVCFGRRGERMASAVPATTTGGYTSTHGKVPFWSRWRKNKV
jgi:hypothetical protein